MLPTAEYRHILRRDLLAFTERAFYEINPGDRLLTGPYLEVIASRLGACRRGEIRRLIINVPPRSLKSHCASVAFPAWILGHDPNTHLICVSYGQELADKFARDCRRVMTSAWYKELFSTRLAERRALHDFMTTRQGSRMATSVGGVLTGRGADLIIIDDALKPDDALSETRRNAVNDWYDHSLLSRLNDKARGCIVIIMQRLHQDDLVGHVLAQEDWEVLSLPAIAEEDEVHWIEDGFGRRPFLRRAGEALHPERDAVATFEQLRRTHGEYVFASQYQQNPISVAGIMVRHDWLHFYNPDQLPERPDEIVQSWDTANKATELSDFSVCTTWAVVDERYYLVDVYRERLEYPALRRKVCELAQRHQAHTVVIEDKASGTQLIQDLKEDSVRGVTASTVPPSHDKVMRLYAQTAEFENGNVLLPQDALWLRDYINELTAFPAAKHDDQVDSTTQALHHMRSVSSSMRTWRRLARKDAASGLPARHRL